MEKNLRRLKTPQPPQEYICHDLNQASTKQQDTYNNDDDFYNTFFHR